MATINVKQCKFKSATSSTSVNVQESSNKADIAKSGINIVECCVEECVDTCE